MDENTPLTAEELAKEIELQAAVMRAKREPGWARLPEFFASTLAKRLLRSVKVSRGQGQPMQVPASRYPGNHSAEFTRCGTPYLQRDDEEA